MITETIILSLVTSITMILGILPDIVSVPDVVVDGINSFLDIIFNNLDLLNVFVPVSTIKLVIPIAIIIMNFEHIYKLIMWIIKKIPFLGIE